MNKYIKTTVLFNILIILITPLLLKILNLQLHMNYVIVFFMYPGVPRPYLTGFGYGNKYIEICYDF